jgi:hypothetical protein
MLYIRGYVAKRLKKDYTDKTVIVTYQIVTKTKVYHVTTCVRKDILAEAVLPVSDLIIEIPVDVKIYAGNIEYSIAKSNNDNENDSVEF